MSGEGPPPDAAAPGEVLFTADQIRERVRALAEEIDARFPPGPIHAVIILKGAAFFAVDLLRALNREASLGFVFAASYRAGTAPGGPPEMRLEGLGEVAGRSVLLIEDILDTGGTLALLTGLIRARGPARLRTCVLLDKPARRQFDVRADHTGFEIEDRFVVGYGLDAGERFRMLPDIRIYRGE